MGTYGSLGTLISGANLRDQPVALASVRVKTLKSAWPAVRQSANPASDSQAGHQAGNKQAVFPAVVH
jgi:hypothetical protein